MAIIVASERYMDHVIMTLKQDFIQSLTRDEAMENVLLNEVRSISHSPSTKAYCEEFEDSTASRRDLEGQIACLDTFDKVLTLLQ